jgi:hypothetical protein
MLIRQPGSLSVDHSAIKRKMDSDYSANQSIWAVWWAESAIDSRLEAGDTNLSAELQSGMPANQNNSFYFNRVRPLLNMVSGIQRKNRKSTIVIPLESGDQHTADQWTKILMHIYKHANIYETISEAFHQGACITGLNLLHVYLDFTNDPINGEIKLDNLSYNYIFMDPYFKKTDLSDCAFVWRRSYLTHTAAASIMPEHAEEIMSLPGNPTGSGRDGRFNFAAESYGKAQQNLVAYDEYYYRDFREQELLIDKATGEVFEVPTNSDTDIDRFLFENPQVKLIKQKIPTVRLCISIQGRVFYNGPQPISGLDDYPFIPIIGYYSPMIPYMWNRIQGIARSLRSAQFLLNRRIQLNSDYAESVVQSGFIFKESAVIDVKHLFQTGAGRMIPIRDEAQMSDIMPIPVQNVPPSFFQLQETYGQEFYLDSGITQETMGRDSDAKSGIVEIHRQNAGLTNLQPIFDRLDAAQNLLGDIIMKIVRGNYTIGKIKQILEGQDPAPLFYNKAFGKYHCNIESGFNTETQKQLQFSQLLQLRELGINIADADMLKAATIQNKEELIKSMQEQAQAQQQIQQQQSQIQAQQQQAQIQLAQARAQADQGLAVERASRVQENYALAEERKAQAHKDDIQAVLDFIKAIKELKTMDLSHETMGLEQIQSLVGIQNLIKSMESTGAPKENPQPAQNSSAQYR